MKILLIGNPNVGKSAIFNHLTGINAITSNYPGTTVKYTKGQMSYKGFKHEVIDVPGTYRLDPEAESEKIAVRFINAGELLVNVIDATNLERNLNLTLQLLELGKPLVIALNMWDDAGHKGIEIDYRKLSKILGVPVFPTNGQTGEGISLLQESCMDAKAAEWKPLTPEERWKQTGRIVNEVQNLSHRHHTLIEVIQDFSIHPVWGPVTAIVFLGIIFRIVISVGEFLTGLLARLFEAIYQPFILWFSDILGNDGYLHSILIGNIDASGIDFESAMGVLTTGVYVALGIVLPYIFLFYLIFGFLEDLGYLPRVAIILDRLLHKIGLHGYSVIPMLLACGCKVPGVLAIRNLETRRERFITAVIVSVTIPCMAQTALIIKVVGQHGMLYVAMTFITLLCVWIVLGMFLNQTVKGVTPTLLMEVPPYRLPGFKVQMNKLRMRLWCFLKEAIPYVLGGILFINLLYVTGFIDWIGRLFSPLIKGVFGLPEESVAALLISIVRKDAAIALLEPLNLGTMQLVTAVIVLTLCFPCIATFTVLLKELRLKDTLKAFAVMASITVFAGGALNLLGRTGSPWLVLVIEAAFVILYVIVLNTIAKSKLRSITSESGVKSASSD